VRRYFARRPLRRRIIALAAAYAIALSSLLASFGAARAAAETAAVPGGIICHSILAGQPAPASDESNGKTCVGSCCVGCLMLMAALPPPPASAAPLLQAPSHRLAPLDAAILTGGPGTKSHRSRAPPLPA
jgi:hypothetical protein